MSSHLRSHQILRVSYSSSCLHVLIPYLGDGFHGPISILDLEDLWDGASNDCQCLFVSKVRDPAHPTGVAIASKIDTGEHADKSLFSFVGAIGGKTVTFCFV